MIGQASPRQFRAARAWLGWTQQELATRTGLDKSTICRMEKGKGYISAQAQVAVRLIYEERKLVFTSFDGIAKRP